MTIQIKQKKREILRAKLFKKIIRERNVNSFVCHITKEYQSPDHLTPLTKELSEITFDGAKKNICLSAPPQHFKTTTLQHWLALHLKINPTANIVYMSYNETLATERTYEIIKILNRMGISGDPKQSTKKQYWTQHGGKITAAGIDVGFTGRKADIIVIDDPHRSLDDVNSNARMKQLINTFTGIVETREQKQTSVIVTHTRWSKNDLIGWVLKNRDYTNINIPVITDGKALLPQLFDIPEIEKKRKESDNVFKAMYMGQPPDSINQVFRSDGVQYYTELPKEYQSFSIGGDLAYTDKTRADFTAIVYMYKADDKYYIDNVERWQRDFNYSRTRLKEIYTEKDTPIQLEYNGVQKGIVDTLIADGVYINKQKIDSSKYTRSLQFASAWNLGNVYMRKAEWNEWYIKELLGFTGSGKEHDDCVDASVYAYKGLQSSFAFA
jgi:predicted phage terminase large subunit-like protein